jgi:hypothetical protein
MSRRSIISQIRAAQGGATSTPKRNNILGFLDDLAGKAPMAAPRVVPGKPRKQGKSFIQRLQDAIANAPMAAPRNK